MTLKSIVNIAIIDDHALFRYGIIRLLTKNEQFKVAGFGCFEDAQPLLESLSIAVVLLDISLGSVSGLEIVKRIKLMTPATRVVILSGHNDYLYVLTAIQSGADGYIHKDVSGQELVTGINCVLRGDRFYSTKISDVLVNQLCVGRASTKVNLTKKEKEVVKHLLKGSTSKEIGNLMKISYRTIETHRSNILWKFNLRNTNELVKILFEQKLEY
jgi:DNA-binding NarL/FixJ family response regulator